MFRKDIKSSRYGNILISGVFLGAWHITVCICEGLAFDVGQPTTDAKLKNKSKNYNQKAN